MRHEQFDESVKRSLYNAAHRLEIHETMKYLEKDIAQAEITDMLKKDNSYSDITLKVFVAKGCLSKAIGQKRTNKNRLIREYGFADVKIAEDESLSGYELKIEEERKRECT